MIVKSPHMDCPPPTWTSHRHKAHVYSWHHESCTSLQHVRNDDITFQSKKVPTNLNDTGCWCFHFLDPNSNRGASYQAQAWTYRSSQCHKSHRDLTFRHPRVFNYICSMVLMIADWPPRRKTQLFTDVYDDGFAAQKKPIEFEKCRSQRESRWSAQYEYYDWDQHSMNWSFFVAIDLFRTIV